MNSASAVRRPARARGPLRALTSRKLPLAIVAFLGMLAVAAIVGFFINANERAELGDYRAFTRDLRTFQESLVDAETGVRGYVLTRNVEFLEPYSLGTRSLEELSPSVLPQLDTYRSSRPHAGGGDTRPSVVVQRLREAWRATITLAAADPASRTVLPDGAAPLLQQSKDMMDSLRAVIGGFVAVRVAAADLAAERVATEQMLLQGVYRLGALTAILATSFAFWRASQDARGREAARHEMEQLFGMANMLQSALDREEANEVLRGKAQYLLPEFSGALYVFNNSRDRLDRSTVWGPLAPLLDLDHIAPNACWALKLGKPCVNGGAGSISCSHHTPGPVVLEIPMAARGEIYGLLQIAHDAPDAQDRLQAARPLALALADAMSLSLSGSALRDQLRNQALRDGLTGLYNRRFLEDMLDRLTQDAARRGVPMSALMIDLDHFKRLNDQYGHSAGDAVLREVARIVMAALRVTDVACRYGGEELLLLLPDCPLDDAVAIAERLREQIEALSNVAIAQAVSASFGVACTPDTTAQPRDLVAVADAALYQAKQNGRNRVEVAPRRAPGMPKVSLVAPVPTVAAL